ncbi:MAG: hypothetical protein ACFNQA_06100 [Flavobacteriaceae bacterium]
MIFGAFHQGKAQKDFFGKGLPDTLKVEFLIGSHSFGLNQNSGTRLGSQEQGGGEGYKGDCWDFFTP